MCDVGSDHGLLPLSLLQRSPALRAVVTDIRPLPLARAKAALEKGGVAERADFVLTDGIAALGGRSVDCFVIAGMSGETIARILAEGKAVLRPGQRFFLQPMSHEDLLRTHLLAKGFYVAEEVVIRENGKLFLLIVAEYSGVEKDLPDPVTAALGEYLPLHPGAWGRAYYEEKRARLVRTAEKRLAADRDASEQQSIIARIDMILEEMP